MSLRNKDLVALSILKLFICPNYWPPRQRNWLFSFVICQAEQRTQCFLGWIIWTIFWIQFEDNTIDFELIINIDIINREILSVEQYFVNAAS